MSSKPARTIQGDPVYKQQTNKTVSFQMSLLLLSAWQRKPEYFTLVYCGWEMVQWVWALALKHEDPGFESPLTSKVGIATCVYNPQALANGVRQIPELTAQSKGKLLNQWLCLEEMKSDRGRHLKTHTGFCVCPCTLVHVCTMHAHHT